MNLAGWGTPPSGRHVVLSAVAGEGNLWTVLAAIRDAWQKEFYYGTMVPAIERLMDNMAHARDEGLRFFFAQAEARARKPVKITSFLGKK